jgi:hypothetical protein
MRCTVAIRWPAVATLLCASALVCVTACDSSSKSQAKSDAGGTVVGDAGDAGAMCTGPKLDAGSAWAAGDDAGTSSELPTWTRVYEEVIVKNSCDSPFCHAGARAGGLDLSPTQDDAYNALVGKEPTGDPCKCKTAMLRVTPGKPAASLMYNKLAAKPALCGLNMPPMPFTPATKPQIELVRAWIEAGAKND